MSTWSFYEYMYILYMDGYRYVHVSTIVRTDLLDVDITDGINMRLGRRVAVGDSHDTRHVLVRVVFVHLHLQTGLALIVTRQPTLITRARACSFSIWLLIIIIITSLLRVDRMQPNNKCKWDIKYEWIIHTYTYTHTNTHTHTHTYIHTYICTHVHKRLESIAAVKVIKNTCCNVAEARQQG